MSILREFFEAHPEVKHADLAEKAGIPLDTLRSYVGGRRTPKVPHALAIERATDGRVPVESWVASSPAPAAPSATPEAGEDVAS